MLAACLALGGAVPVWADEGEPSQSNEGFVAAQTLHGLVLGLEASRIALGPLDESPGSLAFGGFGAAVGLLSSLAITARDPTPVVLQAADVGSLWLGWHALAPSLAVDLAGDATLLLTMAGQVGGAVGASLLARRLGPDPDRLALANAAGLWSGLLAAGVLGALDWPLGEAGHALVPLLVSDLGLWLGWRLGAHQARSREALRWIQAAAALAGGLALGVARLPAGPEVGPAAFGIAAGMSALTLGVGWVISAKRWSNPGGSPTWWSRTSRTGCGCCRTRSACPGDGVGSAIGTGLSESAVFR